MTQAETQSPGDILHTVILQTEQMDALAEFYGKGLGLGEAQAAGEDHLGFQLPNAYLGFDRVEIAPQPTGSISLWFEVDAIHQTFQTLKGLGAKVKYAPRKKPWGAILAAFFDLDGNLFGITQREP